MPIQARAQILARLQAKVAAGIPIIGGGAGTGISAKCEEAGGIDLIVVYNSGRYRMAGRGSLAGLMPYGNANQIVRDMAGEVLTAVTKTPVLAGVCGTDPFMIRPHFLRELRDGRATTPWLRAGDRVRIDMLDAHGASIFGAIDNTVALG